MRDGNIEIRIAMKREKKRKPQQTERKADVTCNASDNLDELIQAQLRKEKRLYPLKINSTTWIYVPKKKCNEKYAEAYRKKMEGRD